MQLLRVFIRKRRIIQSHQILGIDHRIYVIGRQLPLHGIEHPQSDIALHKIIVYCKYRIRRGTITPDDRRLIGRIRIFIILRQNTVHVHFGAGVQYEPRNTKIQILLFLFFLGLRLVDDLAAHQEVLVQRHAIQIYGCLLNIGNSKQRSKLRIRFNQLHRRQTTEDHRNMVLLEFKQQIHIFFLHGSSVYQNQGILLLGIIRCL